MEVVHVDTPILIVSLEFCVARGTLRHVNIGVNMYYVFFPPRFTTCNIVILHLKILY